MPQIGEVLKATRALSMPNLSLLGSLTRLGQSETSLATFAAEALTPSPTHSQSGIPSARPIELSVQCVAPPSRP
jgi:hypothetical protein